MTRRVACLLVLLVLIATGALAQPLDRITRDPARFDRRQVVVHGTVGLVEQAAGRPAFQLFDGAMMVRVLAPPGPAVKPGDRVEVEGTFSVIGNQIDAIRVTWR